MRNQGSTLGGMLLLVLLAGTIILVGMFLTIVQLLVAQSFWVGLAAGVGGSALAGHRIILRNRRLEREIRELHEATDRFLREEGI